MRRRRRNKKSLVPTCVERIVEVEDMIEFPFLDIPDLSNVQQDGLGPPS